MSEKREPGEFYLARFNGEESWTIAETWLTWLHPVRHEVRLRTTDGSEAGFHMVEQWGPRILVDPDLVQVSREELEALRELEHILRKAPYDTRRWVRILKMLDSLRRREGES